jgi:hypothetical protein
VKRLALRREALAELTAGELAGVVSGFPTTGVWPTWPVTYCDPATVTG